MINLHAKDPKRYEVQVLCELFGVSKRAYYKHDESKVLTRAAREVFALEYIKDILMKDPGIGGIKLWHMYRRDFKRNGPVGRDWFADIINKHNLKVRLKVRKPRTTDSHTRSSYISQPCEGLYPDRTKPTMGQRYHVYHHLAGYQSLLLLLPVAHTGCLHRGNHRLVCWSYAGDHVSVECLDNGLETH